MSKISDRVNDFLDNPFTKENRKIAQTLKEEIEKNPFGEYELKDYDENAPPMSFGHMGYDSDVLEDPEADRIIGDKYDEYLAQRSQRQKGFGEFQISEKAAQRVIDKYTRSVDEINHENWCNEHPDDI